MHANHLRELLSEKPEAQWWFATPTLPSLKTIPASQVQDGKGYQGESARLQGELLQAVGQKHVKSLRIPLRSIEGYPLKALDRRDAGVNKGAGPLLLRPVISNYSLLLLPLSQFLLHLGAPRVAPSHCLTCLFSSPAPAKFPETTSPNVFTT